MWNEGLGLWKGRPSPCCGVTWDCSGESPLVPVPCIPEDGDLGLGWELGQVSTVRTSFVGAPALTASPKKEDASPKGASQTASAVGYDSDSHLEGDCRSLTWRGVSLLLLLLPPVWRLPLERHPYIWIYTSTHSSRTHSRQSLCQGHWVATRYLCPECKEAGMEQGRVVAR